MAQLKSTKVKSGGGRKIGREKKKKSRRGSAISMFARGKITAEQYFKLAEQPLHKRG